MSLLKRLGSTPTSPEPTPPAQPVQPMAGEQSMPEYRSSSLTPLSPPPPPAPSSPPMPGGNLSALAGSSSGLSGGTINTSGFLVLADRDAHRKLLELSLWIVDKIQASVGSQTQLQRNEDSERLIQERFTTFVHHQSRPRWHQIALSNGA